MTHSSLVCVLGIVLDYCSGCGVREGMRAICRRVNTDRKHCVYRKLI